MKPIIPFALLSAFLAVGANGAATDPVGYITHSATGTTTGGAGALTITGPTLVQPNTYVGTTTADPSGLTTATFASGVPTTFGTGDLVEITSGAFEGWWSTIMSSTDTTIVTNDAFPAVGGNVTVAVRKHNTVLSFLGDNNPGLIDASGGIGAADSVQFLNPDQSLTSVVYAPESIGNSVDGMGAGWFTTVPVARADDMPILPGTGVLIKTNKAADFTFVSTGAVKLTATQIDIYGNDKLTLVAQTDAVGATLAETGFGDDFIQAASPSDPFDQLQFLNPAQSLTSYGASAGAPAPLAQDTPFLTTNFSDASAVAWAEGVGAIVKRAAGQADGVITINGSTVAP